MNMSNLVKPPLHFCGRISAVQRQEKQGGAMDLTDRLIGHDIWFTRRLLEKAATLTDKPFIPNFPIINL